MNDKKYHLTKEGKEYIDEVTKPIYEDPQYKKFLKTVDKLIDKIIKED